MTAEDEIEQVLSGPEPAYSETPAEALPAEDRQAMNYLRRLARLRADRHRIEELFTTTVDELELRRRIQLDPIEASIAWLEQALALWHAARFREDAKLITIHLPTGTLRSTKAQPRWTYDDEAAFLEWASKHATAAIRHPDPPKDQIDKNGAKKALDPIIDVIDGNAIIKETGEMIPGLKIEPGGDFDLGRFFTSETDIPHD